jgi:hypothetical protein
MKRRRTGGGEIYYEVNKSKNVKSRMIEQSRD